MRSMKKDGSLWHIFHLGSTKWKCRKWTSASIKNTRSWSQISTVTNSYSCAECQAQFTQACHLRRHAEFCDKAETKVECRRNRLLKKSLLSVGSVYHHQLCGHSGERIVEEHAVDGFYLKQRTVLWLPLARLHGLLSTPATKTGKNNIRKSWKNNKRAHKEDVVREHLEMKAKDSRGGFLLVECWEYEIKNVSRGVSHVI